MRIADWMEEEVKSSSPAARVFGQGAALPSLRILREPLRDARSCREECRDRIRLDDSSNVRLFGPHENPGLSPQHILIQ